MSATVLQFGLEFTHVCNCSVCDVAIVTSQHFENMRRNDHKTFYCVNGMKGAFVKVKKRIAKGVCPSCNRTFVDLARHMACKHPSFGGEVIG